MLVGQVYKGMASRHKAIEGDTEEGEKPESSKSATAAKDKNGVTEDESVDEGTLDSEDGGLTIADMNEANTDSTEKESEHSDEEEQPELIFNGTMTRRQSKQFQDAGENFAVFSVRSGKSKNRTCEYCGVVKATPAALVRHLRKHTGERPFICQICGKAYKAKRSLHLHQNSHHKEMGKMLPPNPSALPTQVPIPSAIVAGAVTPAISEATKSLLRETLESSRKAKDGGSGSHTPDSLVGAGSSTRMSERLSTPNLVNLLTSDIPKKVSQTEEIYPPAQGMGSLPKLSDSSPSYTVVAASVKKELEEVSDQTRMKEEDQAEDLSISASPKVTVSSQPSSERRLKCDFCNKSFKHEISRTNHTRTAHNIIINVSGNQQCDSFTLIEPKGNFSTTSLLHTKPEPTSHLHEIPTNFSLLAHHKIRDSPASATPHDTSKLETSGTAGSFGTEGHFLDESNTLPYHVTSRMVQDFSSVEELNIKDTEKSVLAEDGGNRRMRMTVFRETVLSSRLDGINNVTGRQSTAYKCHICSRLFTSMLRYNHHLPSHYDLEVQTFDCRYCEASFRSLAQIVKHLQCHREKFTGLNQAGTALNSSALLLEDFNRKLKPDQHTDANSSLISSSTGVFSSNLQSDDSFTSTPYLEPGERTNGGYSCVKCRKSFARDYLLQRHMRFHQNQNNLSCPDCESTFSGEMDLLEHRRQIHGVKIQDQMQYSSLLKSLHGGVSDLKSGKGLRQPVISDRNNNTSSLPTVSAASVYPLVDMKAFDLRRGEAVEVRMASEVNDSDREERRAMLEEYQAYNAMMLMKASGMSVRDNDSMRQMLTAAGELKKRMKSKEESKKEQKQQEAEEARLKEEKERKRQREQEKLKEKLALEGMGDVTVVLPDAPPLDDSTDAARDTDRPTDLSVTGQPPAGVGFMARKSETPSASTASRIDHVIKSEYGAGTKEAQETVTSPETTPTQKRPSSTPVDSVPPSKSRRKAHKPQKINQNEVDMVRKGEEKNCRAAEAASASRDSTPVRSAAEEIIHNLKSSGLALDPAMLGPAVFGQLSQLASLNSAGSIPPPEMAKKYFSLLTPNTAPNAMSPLAAKYPEKFTISYDGMSNSELLNNNSGAIDLSTDKRYKKATAAVSGHHMNKMSSASSSPSSSTSPPVDGMSKKHRSHSSTLRRSASLDPAALDSDNSLSQELTSATDLSKTSLLNVHIPNRHGATSPSTSIHGQPGTTSPTELDSLVGCPRVLWKSGQPQPYDVPDNFLGVFRAGQWYGKGNKSLSVASKSRTSSPSPVPSPTNSDASSSAESRKITTTSLSRTHSSARATSLSRTHSRLSVVNEPLDRNSLCKPKVLDDGRSVYSCVICHKNFLSLSDINRHMDFHEDIRPYKCKYCDYYARTNSQLKVHKLRHEGVREFCCRVCNYKGVTQSDLNRHTKSQVHLLRSKHVCTQCGEGFVTPKTLDDHSLNCTGASDKSFDNVTSSEIVDDFNDEDYDEEIMNIDETSQNSNNGGAGEAKTVAT